MNFSKNFGRLIAMVAGGLVFTVHPAAAQTSDSAFVYANATIQVEAASIDVAGTQALEFGIVNRPNTALASTICLYELDGALGSSVSVSEVDPTGGQISAFPTPSNCSQTGNARPARFTVSCDPSTLVNLSITFNSTLPTPDVRYELPSDVISSAVQKDATSGSFSIGYPEQPFTATCPDGSAAGSTAGAFDVVVGGRLSISPFAPIVSDTSVGFIELTANY